MKKTVYKKLEVGDRFTFEGSEYIMTNSDGSSGPAVNIWTGEMTRMFPDDVVYLHRPGYLDG